MHINRQIDKDMWHTYMTEFYSAIKENETMTFIGKCLGLEIIVFPPFLAIDFSWTAFTILRCGLSVPSSLRLSERMLIFVEGFLCF